MIISVTERQQFKRCRRMWSYGSFNRDGLQPIVGKSALSLGTLIHNSLAEWLVHPEADLIQLYAMYAVKERQAIQDAYVARVGCGPSDSELAPYTEIIELGLAMVGNYQTFWHKALPDGFTLLAPEQKVNIPIPGTPHHIEMKFDGLIVNEHNEIYVLEHKTYSQRPRLEHLMCNDQFLAYIWGVKQLGLGVVKGLAYDGMWKRAAPPTRPTRGTIDDLFTRILIERSDYELAEFEHYLQTEVFEMELVNRILDEGTDVAYPNRRWEGCFDCSFEMLCTARSKADDEQYLRDRFYTHRQHDEGTVNED